MLSRTSFLIELSILVVSTPVNIIIVRPGRREEREVPISASALAFTRQPMYSRSTSSVTRTWFEARESSNSVGGLGLEGLKKLGFRELANASESTTPRPSAAHTFGTSLENTTSSIS